MEVCDEAFGREAWVEQPLVQILVVVANIQMRTLKTEVGKGSISTAVGYGLVDPKRWGSSVSKSLIFQATIERESG